MRIAYLVNQYPQVSHSFIRREIAALEQRGVSVVRFTLRLSAGNLVDPRDRAERDRTRVLLEAGAGRLLLAGLTAATTGPGRFLRGLRLALKVGWRSRRGPAAHLAYLVEACLLRRWLAEDRIEHVHAHFGTNSTMVAMLCRELGGPTYSFTCHGPEEFDMPLSLGLGEKVHRAAFTAAISDFARSQLYRWAEEADWARIHVIRCGLDRAMLEQAPTPVPDAPRLISIGRLSEQKGQLLLVQAAARLRGRGRSFDLVLVGDGPMRGELERVIAKHDLEGTVRLPGWMSGEQVDEELRRSRALVLPSFAEGLPVVIMEALAAHRPALTTAIAGIPELVEPGVCGWLTPAGSVDRLVEAMETVLDTPTHRLQAMGEQGADRVRRMHDAPTEAGKLAELFAGKEIKGAKPRDSYPSALIHST